MKLEEQVVSLELAKKLIELGVKQENLFIWVYFNDDEHEPTEWWQLMSKTDQENGFPNHKWTCAFTVAELGEILPWDIVIARNIQKQWHINWQEEETCV